MAGSCEQEINIQTSKEDREFINEMSGYQLLEEDTLLWS
jgi:hypothetical protein